MSCSVCAAEKVYALGMCLAHYRKWKFYGDVNFVRSYTKTPIEERFFAKVEKGTGCWLWTAGKTQAGYGVIQEGGRGRKLLLAHRVSYTMHKGPIPEGMNVLHSCDNPSCVNPDHLRSGTYGDNQQDAYDRSRRTTPFALKKNRYQGPRPSLPGESNPNAKLTADDVRAIRDSTEKPGTVAKQFGIIPEYVTKIRKRAAWAHID
jgi:hypothetical protein